MVPRTMRSLERTIVSQGRRYLLRVEQSHDARDYQKYEDIRNDVWGYAEDHLAGTRNMMCENFLAEGGSLFIGAFAEGPDGTFATDGESLVGFCYGFAGILDKEVGFRDPANFRFYAQYAGVRREALHRGLGIPMKEFQREIVRDVFGIGTIICTYDPLTGVNAHRNIHHFGMTVLEYRVATYGEYGGFLNRLDVPTDRFLMSWDLAIPARHVRSEGPSATRSSRSAAEVFRVESRRVRTADGGADVEVVTEIVPSDASTLLVRIPLDFYAMLRVTDVDDPGVRNIPVQWRLHTRKVFTELFARGYRVVDFLKAGPGRGGNYYVLDRP